MIEQFKERFEKLHACAPSESAGGMWYPKGEIDSLFKDMMEALSRFRWRDYRKERPVKSGMYIIKRINESEGDAYIFEECMYLNEEDFQGFCATYFKEENIVEWCEYPDD